MNFLPSSSVNTGYILIVFGEDLRRFSRLLEIVFDSSQVCFVATLLAILPADSDCPFSGFKEGLYIFGYFIRSLVGQLKVF